MDSITKGMPFPERINQTLLSLYARGMTGWGEKYEPFLTTAKETTGLTVEQIKGWIRRRNRKRRYNATKDSEETSVKRPCHSTWHQFMKEYGKTEEGKLAIAENTGKFNKEASQKYKELLPQEKEKLKKESELCVKMDLSGILREAEKIFQKIQKLYNDLDGLGFKGFAVAFYKEYAQVIGSSGTVESFTPAVNEYLHALVTVAHPLPLQLTTTSASISSSAIPPKPSSIALKTPSSSHATKTPSSSHVTKTPSSSHATKTPSSSHATKTPSSSHATETPSSSHATKTPSASLDTKTPSPSLDIKVPPSSLNTTVPSSSYATKAASSHLTNEPSSLSIILNQPTPPKLQSSPFFDQPSTPSPSDHDKPLSPSSGISLSSSPDKEASNVWISTLGLYDNDKAILESNAWLTDSIIYAVQCLLRDQTKGDIFGWQSTQLGKFDTFKPVPSRSAFIQILHVADCHWAVASNVKTMEKSYHSNAVTYYDSLRPLNVSQRLRKNVCSFFKCSSSVLHFDVADVMRQPNTNDCGVFAAAIATELAHYSDPALCRWDTSKMRQHLLLCLETGKMTRFPTLGKRRIGFGARIRRSIVEKLFCKCRLPNDTARPMIACDQCKEWYHKDCVDLDIEKSYQDETWMCELCSNQLRQLNS